MGDVKNVARVGSRIARPRRHRPVVIARAAVVVPSRAMEPLKLPAWRAVRASPPTSTKTPHRTGGSPPRRSPRSTRSPRWTSLRHRHRPPRGLGRGARRPPSRRAVVAENGGAWAAREGTAARVAFLNDVATANRV